MVFLLWEIVFSFEFRSAYLKERQKNIAIYYDIPKDC